MDRYSFEPAATLAADDPARQRNAARDSLFLAAQLKVGSLPAEQVRVRNLSAGGMMAEYPSAVEQGVPVTVELRGIGVVGGRIAWATDGRIGVAFDTHINPMQARKPVGIKPASPRPAPLPFPPRR